MKNFRLTLNQKYGYASIFYGVSIILLAIFGKSSNTLLSISSSLLSLTAAVGFLLTFFLNLILMMNVLLITFIGLVSVLYLQ